MAVAVISFLIINELWPQYWWDWDAVIMLLIDLFIAI